jgi:uncharacterized repeat protein (TIGR03803 family)
MRIGILFALAVVSSLAALPASAATVTPLYSFCNQDFSCEDGTHSLGQLAPDGHGGFFGTTEIGGHADENRCDQGCGVVYALKKGAKKYNYAVLHTFCESPGCADGAVPSGGMIVDKKGNAYGVAGGGGKNDQGVVFEVTAKGKYKVLYDFCSKADCKDGGAPGDGTAPALTYDGAAAGETYDGRSPLYGAASVGGAHQAGAIFELDRNGKKWSEKVLYDFCSQANCADGNSPVSLTMNGAGDLIGQTFGGGNGGDPFDIGGGVVFKFTGGQFTRLYAFCAQANCTDGRNPLAALVEDQAGDLFGTTEEGGTDKGGGTGGVLFEISAGGTYSKLYDFCAKQNCTDGSGPSSAPVIDTDGSLVGVAGGGGSTNSGVIYRYGSGQYDVLYDFCTTGFRCADGQNPKPALIRDAQGHFYGTTFEAGDNQSVQGQGGTIYRFDP